VGSASGQLKSVRETISFTIEFAMRHARSLGPLVKARAFGTTPVRVPVNTGCLSFVFCGRILSTGTVV
jgi:hypothetical protein